MRWFLRVALVGLVVGLALPVVALHHVLGVLADRLNEPTTVVFETVADLSDQALVVIGLAAAMSPVTSRKRVVARATTTPPIPTAPTSRTSAWVSAPWMESASFSDSRSLS